jgi:hypothetical protein
VSVRTIADEQRDKALEHIQEALNRLNDVVILRCSGYEDFNDQYKLKLRLGFSRLIEVRDLLQ